MDNRAVEHPVTETQGEWARFGTRPYIFGIEFLHFSGNAGQMRTVYDRMRSCGLRFAIFTEELFSTGNDIDNRAAVRACPSEELKIVGLAVREEKKIVDKVLRGLSLHQ